MKFIVAPNAFKGCLPATDVAVFIEKGIKKAFPLAGILKLPISDGGDGLIDALASGLNGKIILKTVCDPLGRKINAKYCYVEERKLAIIEMAHASGLALLHKNECNPLITNTIGTGELIIDAIHNGAKKIILGIGGSATNDCGAGVAYAFGWKFYDKNQKEITPCGGELGCVTSIKAPSQFQSLPEIEVLCDVDNPLLGQDGASKVYAPQKGADENAVLQLEESIANFANVIEQDIGIDIRNIPGGGSAGGMGAGMLAFFNAKIKKGTEVVFDLLNVKEKISGADLIITGEGRIDSQTVFGKAPAEIAKLAKKAKIPCIVLCGALGKNIDALYDCGITSVFPICPGPVSLEDSMSNASEYISNTAYRVVRLFVEGFIESV